MTYAAVDDSGDSQFCCPFDIKLGDGEGHFAECAACFTDPSVNTLMQVRKCSSRYVRSMARVTSTGAVLFSQRPDMVRCC